MPTQLNVTGGRHSSSCSSSIATSVASNVIAHRSPVHSASRLSIFNRIGQSHERRAPNNSINSHEIPPSHVRSAVPKRPFMWDEDIEKYSRGYPGPQVLALDAQRSRSDRSSLHHSSNCIPSNGRWEEDASLCGLEKIARSNNSHNYIAIHGSHTPSGGTRGESHNILEIDKRRKVHRKDERRSDCDEGRDRSDRRDRSHSHESCVGGQYLPEHEHDEDISGRGEGRHLKTGSHLQHTRDDESATDGPPDEDLLTNTIINRGHSASARTSRDEATKYYHERQEREMSLKLDGQKKHVLVELPSDRYFPHTSTPREAGLIELEKRKVALKIVNDFIFGTLHPYQSINISNSGEHLPVRLIEAALFNVGYRVDLTWGGDASDDVGNPGVKSVVDSEHWKRNPPRRYRSMPHTVADDILGDCFTYIDGAPDDQFSLYLESRLSDDQRQPRSSDHKRKRCSSPSSPHQRCSSGERRNSVSTQAKSHLNVTPETLQQDLDDFDASLEEMQARNDARREAWMEMTAAIERAEQIASEIFGSMELAVEPWGTICAEKIAAEGAKRRRTE